MLEKNNLERAHLVEKNNTCDVNIHGKPLHHVYLYIVTDFEYRYKIFFEHYAIDFGIIQQ